MTPSATSTNPAPVIAPYLLAACQFTDRAVRERQRRTSRERAKN
ncbi:MAG: hypothetical protein KIH67_001745 [Candidatus Moranbacteria bacterium]|nr:hypothetical protein [Candidatus Moranbacteria bacterium]